MILLGLTAVAGGADLGSGHFWIRALSDFAISGVIIGIAAAPVMELQRLLLLFYGIDIAAELQTL